MKYIFVFSLFVMFFSCSQETLNKAYLEDLERWKENRLNSLTSSDGWTTVVGLQWIPEGESKFGSSKELKIRFPEHCPKEMGTIIREQDHIILVPKEGVLLMNGDQPVADTTQIHLDAPLQIFSWESISFYLIVRLPKYGLRMKDSLADARMNLKELPYFPVTKEWIKNATFEKTELTDSVTIQDVVGTVYKQRIEGYAVFEHHGETHKLLLTDGGEGQYFINFSDLTNGDDTYGGGRFIYIDREDSEGNLRVDFNKAYSPPCEFTAFATCPIPPRENNLDFAVNAGEMVIQQH